MRVVLAVSMFLLFGCGGAQKPAEGSTSDTAALEPSSSQAEDTPPTSASSESKPATAHVAPAASSDAPAPAAPAAFHPAPGATGTIDGKPFEPKIARVSGPVQKDGRVLVTLVEHSDCTPPAAGEGSLTLLVTWKDGYKTDLGSLKRSKKKGSGEIGFSRTATSATFKPTGTVTVVTAPADPSATGKMKIDLQSGDYMLAGDLDVCVPKP
jgi:hypothetical protein